MELQYRHEWKHVLRFGDLLVLRQRLRAVMEPDPHAVGGSYRVRSLYFDTFSDQALREKLDGVSEREKFRLRLYNQDPSVIRLEKKSRRGSLSWKQSVGVQAAEVQRLLIGELGWMEDPDRPLAQELFRKMQGQGLRPKTLVDYVREPFVFGPGDVRVTLDYDIRTGLCCTDLLDPEAVLIPAGDAPILLEVKWGAFLPAVIRDAVCVPDRRVGAFSKYAQCRVYG